MTLAYPNNAGQYCNIDNTVYSNSDSSSTSISQCVSY